MTDTPDHATVSLLAGVSPEAGNSLGRIHEGIGMVHMGLARATGVLTACALAASLLGAASASGAPPTCATCGVSYGIYIHNLTFDTPLELSNVFVIKGGFEGPGSGTAPPPPIAGEVLKPGAVRHIELRDIHTPSVYHPSEVELRYRDNAGRRIELGMAGRIERYGRLDPSLPTISCFPPRPVYECEISGKKDVYGRYSHVSMVDGAPTGTVPPPHTVPSSDPQKQAETLRRFCTTRNLSDNVTSCKFTPTERERTFSAPRLVGTPVVNCSSRGAPLSTKVKADDVARLRTSFGIDDPNGPDTEAIFSRAERAIKDRHGSGLAFDEVHFSGETVVSVPPLFLGWVEGRDRVQRDTGDFSIGFGSSTANVTDVHFDSPDLADNQLYRDAHSTPTTGQQDLDVCDHGRRTGLVPAPASYVTIKQRGDGGADAVLGGRESTTVIALAGSDNVDGAAGNDRLYGGPGRDFLFGGPGSDTIVDSLGRTRVSTGAGGRSGPDSVDVRDGEGDDTVVCGSPRVTVKADRRDRIRACGKSASP